MTEYHVIEMVRLINYLHLHTELTILWRCSTHSLQVQHKKKERERETYFKDTRSDGEESLHWKLQYHRNRTLIIRFLPLEVYNICHFVRHASLSVNYIVQCLFTLYVINWCTWLQTFLFLLLTITLLAEYCCSQGLWFSFHFWWRLTPMILNNFDPSSFSNMFIYTKKKEQYTSRISRKITSGITASTSSIQQLLSGPM